MTRDGSTIIVTPSWLYDGLEDVDFEQFPETPPEFEPHPDRELTGCDEAARMLHQQDLPECPAD